MLTACSTAGFSSPRLDWGDGPELSFTLIADFKEFSKLGNFFKSPRPKSGPIGGNCHRSGEMSITFFDY
jgi:hypothetical protein